MNAKLKAKLTNLTNRPGFKNTKAKTFPHECIYHEESVFSE